MPPPVVVVLLTGFLDTIDPVAPEDRRVSPAKAMLAWSGEVGRGLTAEVTLTETKGVGRITQPEEIRDVVAPSSSGTGPATPTAFADDDVIQCSPGLLWSR